MKEKLFKAKHMFVLIVILLSFLFIFNASALNVFALDKDNQLSALALLTATSEPESDEPWNEEGVIAVNEGGILVYPYNTYIVLWVGWEGDNLQPLMDAIIYTAYLDGVYLPSSGGYYTPIYEWGDWYSFDYYYDLGILSPGTYSSGIYSSDVFCEDEDCYGPFDWPVTIIIEEATPTPTPTYTPTPTPTHTPTPTLTPTSTLTPTPTPTHTSTLTNTPTSTSTSTPEFTDTVTVASSETKVSVTESAPDAISYPNLEGEWVFSGVLNTNIEDEDINKYNGWRLQVVQDGNHFYEPKEGEKIFFGYIDGKSIQFTINGDDSPDACGDYSEFNGTIEEDELLQPSIRITGILTGHDCGYDSVWDGEFEIIISSHPPTPTTEGFFVLQDESLIKINPPKFVNDEYFNVTYRAAGPLTPKFTTKIPTPLDISLAPEVIGTNLFLVALLMIPLAYANELLGRMMNENKANSNKKAPKRPGRWFNSTISLNPKGGVVAKDKIKILVIILIYGLIFSLLDETWTPFSKEGMLVFLSMAVVFGIVGVLDDYIQWRRLKKWNLSIDLNVKSRNFLVAIISVVISRFLFLVPGVLFGAPELLQIDDEDISEKREKQLNKISMITLAVIGLVSWVLTIFTRKLFESSVVTNGTGSAILLGIEAMLLVVFAVIVENYFIYMLGLPGSFGHMLKKSNPIIWFFGLMSISFLFIHTLINPQGDLITAIQKGNVLMLVGVVVLFVTVVLSIYAYRWARNRPERNILLTIGIIVFALFCLFCIVTLALGWAYGDQILIWVQSWQ